MEKLPMEVGCCNQYIIAQIKTRTTELEIVLVTPPGGKGECGLMVSENYVKL